VASSARQHAEWLSLIEVSGPFLSLPALMRAFPQGLDAHDPNRARSLHLAYEEWGENRSDRAIHRQWTRYVLTHLLAFPTEQLQEGPAIPDGLTATVAEQGETLRPDIIVRRADRNEAARLLITIVPPTQGLDAALAGAHWKASPATRMVELLRGTGVPLGLVTNGEQWMLVHAPRGETAGFASWYASLWFDETVTLRAFRSLLEARRFFGVPDGDTLEALLVESAANQQEVTDQLGTQVRQAVEVLVRTLDSLDRDAGRALLMDLPPSVIYEAALTVMMRLVFLFSAEERGLLRLGDPLYDQFYAVSTLRAQLRTAADQQGEEVLERRSDAWSRLLATFRAVYGGIGHEDLRLPAYGGDLFDPDRFPFLEGRAAGTSWRDAVAAPLAIDNRTVLHLLEALQVLRIKVPGGPPEPRLLSFRALDIEQIGHVYEGLLDHTAKHATEAMLSLIVSGDLKKVKRPDMPLAELEALRSKGGDALLAALKEATGRSENALRKDLDAELKDVAHAAVRTACDNDADLTARVVPFAGLVRADSFGRPQVIPEGSVFVTAGTDRRATGTHYTPRSLTEPIVKHTLDPLAFHGPAEGLPEGEWTLRSAADLLRLTVCDMAMGSGAFLVQACRYLSERLVEAWERAEEGSGGRVVVTPEGDLSTGAAEEQPLPRDPDERLAIARRIVADHCLYGVDKNPLAVEMGKLSLWLIILQKDRPFTFLDHRLRCGDSLLGVDIAQLTHWSLRPEHGPQQRFITKPLEDALKEVRALRNKISATMVLDARDADEKARLLQKAEEAISLVHLGADLLIAAAFAPDPRDRETLNNDFMVRYTLMLNAMDAVRAGAFTSEGEIPAREAFTKLRAEADNLLGDNRPFHWPLEFPEVFTEKLDGTPAGFAAIVGNPPFQGGSRITGSLGTPYRDYLVDQIADGRRGGADLCAYFFLRAAALLRQLGGMSLLATNTIAQGDTREVGLDYLVQNDFITTAAIPSRKWPGEAGVHVACVWLRHGDWDGRFLLDGTCVSGITSFLTAGEATLERFS